MTHGFVKERDFACPIGLPIAETEEERAGLGTMLEKLIGMIPGVKKLPCYGPDGRLKPQSECAKRRDALDRLLPD